MPHRIYSTSRRIVFVENSSPANIFGSEATDYYDEEVTLKSQKLIRENFETGFTISFMAFLPIVTLSVMVYVANIYRAPGLNNLLAVSPETPWGIITSLVVHANEAHLFNNMISLFLFLMLLIALNVFQPQEEMRVRVINGLLIIFLIPVALNLGVILLAPGVTMIGSSGMVFALEGACLGFAFLNAMELRKIRRHAEDERRMILAASLSNAIVCAGFLLNLILFPEAFLGSTHETVSWFHRLSFGGGCLAAVAYLIWHKTR